MSMATINRFWVKL